MTGQVVLPEHSPQPGRIMYMPEEMGMFIEETMMGTFSSEITVNGVPDHATGLVISSRLTGNINPGNRDHSNTIIITEANPGQTAVMVTVRVVPVA